jgi:hypothetical protein
MRIVVFTGPTLSPEDARRELDADYRPPAAQGDVYRAALERPLAIGIVDGYFERIPAVWHKEILWALSQGVHVLGASSMGALRAAELEPYGMEGVGAIFEAVRSGELEDDDEVAVAHGAADTGYRATSEAMVNLRATLRAAEKARVVTRRTRAALERIAKELYYPERAYPVVLARGREARLPAEQLDALSAFLREGRVNQKRDDALALLRRLRELRASAPGPKQVAFPFEHTDAWDQVSRQASAEARGATTANGTAPERLAEELRLEGAAWPHAWRGAMLRAIALMETRRQGIDVGRGLAEQAERAFRVERGLVDDESLRAWRAHNHLANDADWERFVRDEARLRWLEAMFETDARRHLAEELRAAGDYPRVQRRAGDKERVLGAHGAEAPGLDDAGVDEDELWRWYFEERLGRPRPAAWDAHLRDAGPLDADALRQEALRELLYERLRRRGPE